MLHLEHFVQQSSKINNNLPTLSLWLKSVVIFELNHLGIHDDGAFILHKRCITNFIHSQESKLFYYS